MPFKNIEDRRAYEKKRRQDPVYREKQRECQVRYRAGGGKRREYERLRANPKKYAKFKKQQGVYRHRRRTEALEMYGGKCACCGESESMFLAFDHIDGSGGEQRKSMTAMKFMTWILKEKRSNIRILCHNCNFATRLGGPCPHQT